MELYSDLKHKFELLNLSGFQSGMFLGGGFLAAFVDGEPIADVLRDVALPFVKLGNISEEVIVERLSSAVQKYELRNIEDFIRQYSLNHPEYGRVPELLQRNGESRLSQADSILVVSEGIEAFAKEHPDYFDALSTRRWFCNLLRASFGTSRTLDSIKNTYDHYNNICRERDELLFQLLQKVPPLFAFYLEREEKDKIERVARELDEYAQQIPSSDFFTVRAFKWRAHVLHRDLGFLFDEVYVQKGKLEEVVSDSDKWKAICDYIHGRQ